MGIRTVACEIGAASYRWELPFGFRARFGGPAFELEHPEVRARWLRDPVDSPITWVLPKQQHGGVVRTDFRISDQLENRCDGLATAMPEMGLGVFGSDCPAIAVLSPDAYGLAHCGWRGFCSGIVDNLVDAVRSQSRYAVDAMVGFIGPGICRDCYQVGADVLDATEWPAPAVGPVVAGKAQLDLPLAVQIELKRNGIGRIIASGTCTACAPDLHSNRHQGPGVVQVMALYRSTRGEHAIR
jgi:copper oxidase (laccase) domain-containing protein